MKNIIIAGDSFCASLGWPEQLAAELKLQLVKRGTAGASWWVTRNQLRKLSSETINNTEVIVLCHTNPQRLPVKELCQIDLDNINKDDMRQLALKLYYTHIFNWEFLEMFVWAQCQWIKEINHKFAGSKILHLHCSPWSVHATDLFGGMSVTPNLSSISLNEIGAKSVLDLKGDSRPNHLNGTNNQVLASELANLIINYKEGPGQLSIEKFDLITSKWFDWQHTEDKDMWRIAEW